MTKTLDMCFRESERYLCTKHMKDNLNHFLIQKEEIDEKSRRKTMNEIFGPGGLADSNDTFIFESSSSMLQNSYREYEQLQGYERSPHLITSLKVGIQKIYP